MSWTKDSESIVNLTSGNRAVTEGQGGLNLTFTMGAKTVDVKVYYEFFGNAVYMVDHNLFLIKDDETAYKTVLKTAGSRCNKCAIYSDNRLLCWGSNYLGQVGNGTTANVSTPTIIDSGTNYLDVEIAGSFTCGITSARDLKCWGQGLGTTKYLTPQTVNAGTTYKDVAMAYWDFYALTTAGQIHHWPSGDITQASNVISPGVTFKSIKAHMVGTGLCGMTTDDRLLCTAGTWDGIHLGIPRVLPTSRWPQ